MIFEFMGACLMVYSYNLTHQSSGAFGRPLAYIIGYLLAVQISGAHFNPATTLAVWTTE